MSWRGMGAELGARREKRAGKTPPTRPRPLSPAASFFFFPAPAPHPIPRRAPPAFPLALTPSPSFLFPPPLLPPPPPSDLELAKFEAFLKKEGGAGVSALVRGRQRLAYPIKGYWEGVYVLYRFSAKRATSQGVQKLLSTPAVGAEANVLRHMTFAT